MKNNSLRLFAFLSFCVFLSTPVSVQADMSDASQTQVIKYSLADITKVFWAGEEDKAMPPIPALKPWTASLGFSLKPARKPQKYVKSYTARQAAIFLYEGHAKKASHAAKHLVSSASAEDKGYAQWVLGLSSWLAEDYEHAAAAFVQVAESRSMGKGFNAAGAFWAARAYEKLGQRRERKAWLKEAASIKEPSFYGLLAADALGQDLDSYRSFAQSYPVGTWIPQESYKIDPALVHAIIRQESRFNPKARSKRGARGLMQIMPKTAHYVSTSQKLDLNNPRQNLKIGQHYLQYLLDSKIVDGDLIMLLSAYNGGPGNLKKWRKRWGHIEDPLLFVELIPSGQTRNYVEHVMTNYWMYAINLGRTPESMESLTQGRFPQYQDNQKTRRGFFKLASR